MDKATVERVRRFNRTVTQRIGALDDEYLGRRRSLGASRLLWEIGPGGTDARALRARLDLDSGYLSRLLRSLEQDGLVTVEPDRSDKRVRSVRLTRAGRAERALLDGQSDELARALLAPLSPPQRARLVDAMDVVERLLTAGLVEIEPADPTSDAARFCLDSYFAELDTRFESGFDLARALPLAGSEMTPPAGVFLLAQLRNEPIGCVGLKLTGRGSAEIKRMWVAGSVRGLGVGRRLLATVEAEAVRRGARVVRLDTNRSLHEAISLYQSAGFVEVEPFNDEPHAHHWFEKRLDAGRARGS